MTTQTLADKEAEFLQQSILQIRQLPVQDIEDSREAVAKAAYYKAEKRGFEPGHELPDWLEAEAEIRSARA